MGFAERNSKAGRMSSISFPDAIKRGSSDSATQFTIQITDANGSPNDPDSATLYVRVTNAAGTAQDSLLYTDSGLSSAATNSTNGTYANSGSAFWKSASTSNGSVTLFHKTGTASSVEGIYHLEYAWFEGGEAISGSQMFRIIDLADMDDLNTNVGSDSDGSSASGSVHAKIKDVKAAVAALNDPTAAGNADAVWDEATSGHSNAGSAGKALTDILADTNELQGDWTNGGRLDAILDAAATAAALAVVDQNVDDVEAAVGALNDSASADYGTDKTAMGMLRKLGADVATVDGVADAILVDTGTTIPATLGSPAGASMAADIAAVKAVVDSILTDTGTTLDDLIDTEVAAILADTHELQGDWVDGGRLDAILDAVKAVTDVLPDSGALSSIATAAALAVVDQNVDDVESAVGALDAAASADYGTSRPAMAMLRKLGADVATVDGVADAILVDTGTTLPATLGSPAGASMSADVAAVKSVVDGIQSDLSNGTDGLGALKDLIDTVDTVADGIQSDLSNGTDGLGVIKSAIDAVSTAVSAVQNNTRFVAVVPPKLNRPGSGSEAVGIVAYLYDTSGNMEDPDSNELFVKIMQVDGTAIASRYYSDSGLSSAISAEGSGTFSGYYPLTRVAAGKYMFFYKSSTGDAEESLSVEFGWEEGSAARLQARGMQISDAADLDDIVADTNELQGDWTDGGRLDTILDSVLADTAALDSAWADGGRLDAILDGVLADTATLGAPAGASHAADIAAIKTVVDSILVDTGTTLDDLIDTEIAAILADTHELQGDWVDGGRLDLLLDAVKAVTDALPDSGALSSIATAAALAVVDQNVDDVEAAVGALGAAASADYGTDKTAMGMIRKLGADVATVDGVADAILVDTGTTIPATLGSPAGASMSADVAALKTVADGIQTDLSNGTDGLGALKSLIDTADAAIDAVGVDVGDFSGGSNLQSLKAVIGTKLDAQNVALDAMLMLANGSVYKVASNSHSGSGGTFTLTTLGSGYHGASAANDEYVGGTFCVLAGGNVGRIVQAVDYNGSNGQVTYGGASLADDDVIGFIPAWGYIGRSDDAAASSASDAGKSLFARLRYMADQMEANKGTQRGTFKKYLKRSTAGTLGNDPTDTAESAAGTTTSDAFTILDVQTISFDEGSDASIEDIFAVFKWKHQGTNGGGGGGITTKWYMSGGASAPSAGAAISSVGDAVAVSDGIAGTSTASTNSVSGLINQNALDAFSNGKIHVMLCGKAGTSGDTCTGWIFHSSSLEVTYEV